MAAVLIAEGGCSARKRPSHHPFIAASEIQRPKNPLTAKRGRQLHRFDMQPAAAAFVAADFVDGVGDVFDIVDAEHDQRGVGDVGGVSVGRLNPPTHRQVETSRVVKLNIR